MMSEKRLTYTILFNNYYQIREVDDDGYCRRLAPTGIIDLLNEQQDTIAEQKGKVARVLNEYSRQFRRHSKEFSFMLDLAEDLGVQSLEAKDD